MDQARKLLTLIVTQMLNWAAAAGPAVTPTARLEAAAQSTLLAERMSPSLLPLHDQTFFWDAFASSLLTPVLTAAVQPPEAVTLQWADFRLDMEQHTAGHGLVHQLQWLLEHQRRFHANVAARQQEMTALLTQRGLLGAVHRLGQQAAHAPAPHVPGAGARQVFTPPPPAAAGRLPPAGQAFQWQGRGYTSVNEAVAVNTSGKPGCQYWSGVSGSCRRALTGQCPHLHTPGQPSPFYAAKAEVLRAAGLQPDEQGNFKRARLDAAATSASSSFRSGGAGGSSAVG